MEKMNLNRGPAAGAHQKGRMRRGKEKKVGRGRRKTEEEEGRVREINGGSGVEEEEDCIPEITCIHAARGQQRPERKAGGRTSTSGNSGCLNLSI